MSSKKWIFGRDPAFPEALEPHKISMCTLEFLDIGPVDGSLAFDPNRLVHCILRVKLDPALTKDSSYAPTNTYSLVLDLTADNSDHTAANARSVPVEMLLKACTYEGPHWNAMRATDLPVNGRKTVGDFLRARERLGSILANLFVMMGFWWDAEISCEFCLSFSST